MHGGATMNATTMSSLTPGTFRNCFESIGVHATLGSSFGGEELPTGLVTIIGQRTR